MRAGDHVLMRPPFGLRTWTGQVLCELDATHLLVQADSGGLVVVPTPEVLQTIDREEPS